MIIHGEALDIMRGMDCESFGAVITDPPYSSGGMFRGDRMADTKTKYTDTKVGAAGLPSFTGDNRDGRSFTSWCAEWLSIALGLCKEGAPIVLFSDWRQLPSVTDALQWAGGIWRGVAVWDKVSGRPQKGRYRQQAEFIVWGSKGPMSFDRPVPVLPGVFTYSAPSSAIRQHQTEKPIALMRELVRIAEPGTRILDPFVGSGTTSAAAMLEGYDCVGIELSEYYAGIARQREEDATLQKCLI